MSGLDPKCLGIENESTNLFGKGQAVLGLEDTDEVGSQVGEDDELPSRVEHSLVRARLLLRLGGTGFGRRREGWAGESHNARGIFDVKGVDATSGARYAC